MTAVLVVEDQQALASALEVAIGAQPDLECLGSAGTVDDALEQVARHVPDVVLMDIQLPGGSGIECTRLIKASYPEVTVLILTADASATRLAQAAAAGATGFLTKGSSFADILTAIRNPAGAKMVIEGTTLWALIDALRDTEPEPAGPAVVPAQAGREQDWARLTAREQEVLALMGEGLDPKAIAERLVVSLHTARGHVKSVMTKLGAHSQLEAVVVATRSGLLSHDGSAPAHLCPLIRWPPTIWGVRSDHLRVAVSARPAIAWVVCATQTRTRRFPANRAGHRAGGPGSSR
jgi:DNA-binding NarL/FixJ family response regulator